MTSSPEPLAVYNVFAKHAKDMEHPESLVYSADRQSIPSDSVWHLASPASIGTADVDINTSSTTQTNHRSRCQQHAYWQTSKISKHRDHAVQSHDLPKQLFLHFKMPIVRVVVLGGHDLLFSSLNVFTFNE